MLLWLVEPSNQHLWTFQNVKISQFHLNVGAYMYIYSISDEYMYILLHVHVGWLLTFPYKNTIN